MPAMHLLQAISKHAENVGGTPSFQVFLGYNITLYLVFVMVWYRVGLANCKLPDDAPTPTWLLAFYTATATHVGFSMPNEIEPKNSKARLIIIAHSLLAWFGLLIWASSWS